MLSFQKKPSFKKSASLILLAPSQLKSRRFVFSNKPLAKEIQRIHEKQQFAAERDQLFPLLFNGGLVLLAGVGEVKDNPLTALRITVRKALLSSYLSKIKEVELVPHSDHEEVISAIIEGVLIGTYAWKKYVSKDPKSQAVDKKAVVLIASPKSVYDEKVKICEGVNFSRDLINDNADTATSEFIEKKIREVIRGQKKVSLEVLNQRELKAKGLNLILAVNQGSPKAPKLIIVRYRGGAPTQRYIAVVGKGITFDTGGLNLKPTGSIETMRADMSGTAATAGILKNVLALKLRKNILFAFAIAENAIGSNAYKPGDVFRSYLGKTVEINNTDAEGRLVLADAIAYVVKNYKPARLIDLATLTGACVVALGHDYSGIMTNDVELSKQLIRSSNETDDRAWRLPLYPEIKDSVSSLIADIRNTGFPKGAAGASTGAEFLRQFTQDTPWAHLDIAGTAYVDGPGRWYFGQGATGAGVRLVTDFLKNS